MYKIIFYKDKNGKSDLRDYIEELANRKDKDSQIKLRKISEYISLLKQSGTYIGEPYVKHLKDEIWELRPLKDRILFAALTKNGFILLHQFKKKTQKTPPAEIKTAINRLLDFNNRNEE